MQHLSCRHVAAPGLSMALIRHSMSANTVGLAQPDAPANDSHCCVETVKYMPISDCWERGCDQIESYAVRLQVFYTLKTAQVQSAQHLPTVSLLFR